MLSEAPLENLCHAGKVIASANRTDSITTVQSGVGLAVLEIDPARYRQGALGIRDVVALDGTDRLLCLEDLTESHCDLLLQFQLSAIGV